MSNNFERQHYLSKLADIFPANLVTEFATRSNPSGFPNVNYPSSSCAICHSRKRLYVHHLNYRENVRMLLCRSCHVEVHFGTKYQHLNPVGKRYRYSDTLFERINAIRLPIVTEQEKIYRHYRKFLIAVMHPKTKPNEHVQKKFENTFKTTESSHVENDPILIRDPTLKDVVIHTEGLCDGDHGPGGCSAILSYGEHIKRSDHSYYETTKKRMLMMGVIIGLEALKMKCDVILYTNNKHIIYAFSKGWVNKWKDSNWMRQKGNIPIQNIDLWE